MHKCIDNTLQKKKEKQEQFALNTNDALLGEKDEMNTCLLYYFF